LHGYLTHHHVAFSYFFPLLQCHRDSNLVTHILHRSV
jgi:hypothetical protein